MYMFFAERTSPSRTKSAVTSAPFLAYSLINADGFTANLFMLPSRMERSFEKLADKPVSELLKGKIASVFGPDGTAGAFDLIGGGARTASFGESGRNRKYAPPSSKSAASTEKTAITLRAKRRRDGDSVSVSFSSTSSIST